MSVSHNSLSSDSNTESVGSSASLVILSDTETSVAVAPAIAPEIIPEIEAAVAVLPAFLPATER
ncbi:hypothetical protein Tco_0740166, partial [Tanacetum coccineum]